MFYRKQIANNTFTTGSLSSWSMGITLGNTLLSLGRVFFLSTAPHCMRKAFPSPSLMKHPQRQEQGKAIQERQPSLPISCCFELGFMGFCVHLLPASARNGEDLSAQNELSQAFLLPNQASKSFTSPPDVSVFWTNRKRMYCSSPWRPGPAQTEKGGNPPLDSRSQALACLQEQGWARKLHKPKLWQRTAPEQIVWPLGETSPHLWKVSILLKF